MILNNVEIINLPSSRFNDPSNRSLTIQINAYLNGEGVPGASGGLYNQELSQ
jgi:hypothetical protein